MDEKVLKYRKKYKKCKYCKYLCMAHCGFAGDSYYQCMAKDKLINNLVPDMTNVLRPFCSCYEVKDKL